MKKIIISFIQLIFFVVLIISLYKIFNWYKDNKNNEQIINEISNSIKIDNDNKTIVDFQSLKRMNNDTIGYIKINNTNIDYPVVKYIDNDYYLNHNFEKKSNVGGWIFLNYNNNIDDKNIIIFGHNMKNGSMFGTLKNTLKKEWQQNKSNHTFKFITEEKEYTYKIFSTYQTKVEDYYLKNNFNNDKEYMNFINTIKKRSNYDYNVDINSNDKIITLSTCSGNNYRVVVHAKKVMEE